MKRLISGGLLAGLLAGCASAPRPKAPDESHRIPVNRTVPEEAARPEPPGPPAARDRGHGDSVEWR